MLDYRIFLFILSLAVDILLLLAANRLWSYPTKPWRLLWAGFLGGVHSLWCTTSGFRFLGSFFWYMVFLVLKGLIAYGLSLNAIRRTAVFMFLSLAISGILSGLGDEGAVETLSAVAMILLLCLFGFRGRIGGSGYLPVELSYGDKKLHITALQDTGNRLRDPITGRHVLVVSADVAQELTGLTPQQLKAPLDSINLLPGLRLIPYQTVGNRSFLLAICLSKVKIGSWQGSTLVAFAPNSLSSEGNYQALAGGVI